MGPCSRSGWTWLKKDIQNRSTKQGKGLDGLGCQGAETKEVKETGDNSGGSGLNKQK